MKHTVFKPPYSHPSESYNHLLKYTQTPNAPQLPPNCPVTLYIRMGGRFINWRTYESFEAISRYMTSDVFHSHVVVNLDHFRDKYRALQIKKLYRLITGNRHEGEDPHADVWKIFQSGKVVKMKAKLSNKGNSFLFDLKKLAEVEPKAFPRQCMQIIAALIDSEVSAYDMNDLKVLSANLHKYGLKTKQPPFKILQYYLPQLHDAGFVEYPRKQYNSEDDDGE